jgi:fermentation-respiration switch protein FrsA (DUF1100 family)
MSLLVVWKLGRLLFVALAVGYLLLAVLAPVLASRLLYHPGFGSSRAPAGLRKIPAGDGTELAVIHLPNPGARFTLWYFHGNAEDLGDVEPILREFHEAGFAVFAAEYPGYGHSGGRPSESSLYASARVARAHLRHELRVPAARTIVYGHSLGGGVAVQLAAEEKLGGLVLQSAFLSAYRVLTRWRLLPFDQFENERKLRQVACPVLVMHGRADDVISIRHGEALFAAAPEPKRACWVPGAGHNDLRLVAGRRYWDELGAFRELCARAAGG